MADKKVIHDRIRPLWVYYCAELNELYVSDPIEGNYLVVSEPVNLTWSPDSPIKYYRYDIIGEL